jgi:hypothetical protein
MAMPDPSREAVAASQAEQADGRPGADTPTPVLHRRPVQRLTLKGAEPSEGDWLWEATADPAFRIKP